MQSTQNFQPKGGFQSKKSKKKKKQIAKQSILTDDEYFVFSKLFDSFQEAEDEDSKESVAEGFFELLCSKSNSKKLLTDQLVSRMIDTLLPHAGFASVEPVMRCITEDLRLYAVDKCSSHVIQALLAYALQTMQTKAGGETSNAQNAAELKEFLLKVVKFMYNNLDEFISDTNASYVLRSILEVTSGIELPSSVRNSCKAQFTHSIQSKSMNTLVVPSDVKAYLAKYTERLCQIPQYQDLIFYESASAVLQSAILVLAECGDAKSLDLIITHILDNAVEPLVAKEGQMVECLLQSHAICRLLEAILPVASSDRQHRIFVCLFKDNMKMAACDHVGNHCLQKLCASWKQKKTFCELVDAVVPCFGDICEIGYTAILHFLTRTAKRLRSQQKQIVKAMKELLNCEEETDQLALCLLYLQPRGNPQIGQVDLSLHGSLILQELLHFKHNTEVVESLLCLEVKELCFMACHPKGSHVVDAFTKSSTVETSLKEKIVDKFQGIEVDLACSKNGSMSLEALWQVANVDQKTQIGNRLLEKESMMKESLFGRVIYNKLQLKTHHINSQKRKFTNPNKLGKCQKLLEDIGQNSDMPPLKKQRTERKTKSNVTKPWRNK